MSTSAFEIFAKLFLDTNDYEKKLKNAGEGANNFASSFKSALGTAGKVAAAGGAALVASAGVVAKFTQEAVESYGNYEQLVGGVQKLYGNAGQSLEEYAEANKKSVDDVRDEWQALENAQNTVIKNAEMAYMTSGMSMNEYMENATTLSASLIKSLGGDTQKAAEITDIAMRAMSDNVNTFGTDAAAVQNAFSGLSRQNYTMLDNLKLGYAGTAQGMLELINDSGILGKRLTDTSELATVGFDKMILAIEEVQKQQGIAGTTAREALHTIQGSATATQKAWQSVITAIGKGEGLDQALEGLSTAILGDGSEGSGLIGNVVPRIESVLDSIGEFIVKAAPMILDNVADLVGEILPGITEATFGLLQTLSQFIIEKIPEVFTTGLEFIRNLVGGINESLPEATGAIVGVITDLIGEFIKALPDIITTGFQLIGALIEGIIGSIPDIIDGIGEIIDAAVEAFKDFDWISLGKSIIDGLVSGITKFGGKIKDSLVSTAKKAWSGIKSFFGISSPSKLMRDTIGRFIPEGLAEGIEDTSDEVFDAMEDLANGTADSYNPVFEDVVTRQVKSSENDNPIIREIRELKQAILGLQITLDTGALVGEITPAIDTQLGTISGYRGRGM